MTDEARRAAMRADASAIIRGGRGTARGVRRGLAAVVAPRGAAERSTGPDSTPPPPPARAKVCALDVVCSRRHRCLNIQNIQTEMSGTRLVHVLG